MIRIGILLIACGITFFGFSVSPAVKPTSSIPTKANTTIWKERISPFIPFGNMPPCCHKFEKLAVPEDVENPLKIINKRSEEHTCEIQSRFNILYNLLLDTKK